MKRLLWKELRERRVWALSWAAIVLAVSLWGKGQYFCGEAGIPFLSWMPVSLLAALVVGVSTYSSELVRGRGIFAFSRPLPWQSLLLAKVLFGIMIAVGAPLLAALIFRLTCAPEYRAFATLPHLLDSAWQVAWPMLLLYLFGTACSVVLSGFAGGFLTLVVVVLCTLVPSQLLTALLIDVLSQTAFRQLLLIIGLLVGIGAATLLAGLHVARHGLYQELDGRLKRFTSVFVPVFIALWLLGLVIPARWTEHLLLRWEPVVITASPRGKYALALYEQRLRLFPHLEIGAPAYMFTGPARVLRVADHTPVLTLPNSPYYPYEIATTWQWVTDDTAYYQDAITNKTRIVHVQAQRIITASENFRSKCELSPDQRYFITRIYSDKRNHYNLQLVNLQTGKVNHLPLLMAEGRMVWWQSRDAIGYFTPEGKRAVIRVSLP